MLRPLPGFLDGVYGYGNDQPREKYADDAYSREIVVQVAPNPPWA